MIDRSTLNAWLLPFVAFAIFVLFFFVSGDWYVYTLLGIALVAIVLLLFVNYIWNLLYRLVLRHSTKPIAACPYYTAEECPHSDKSECRFDTTVCHIRKPHFKKYVKRVAVILILILSAIVTIMAELLVENGGFLSFLRQNYDVKTLLKILQPLSNSLIAAIVIYFLIDIPSRLKEYQHFFVDLLASDKYLKLMDEKSLTRLRKDVTKQLHIKDFPNMPKGLIGIDERFCEMLKHPYFKTYSQTTTVNKVEGNTNMLKKKVRIEYIAYNAHGIDRSANFDIGFANSLYFVDVVDVDKAKQLFQLNSYRIYFDDDDNEVNLLPKLRIGVAPEQKDGFLYNGRVVLMPKESFSNKNNPFEKEALTDNSNAGQSPIIYEMLDESSKAGLYVRFKDKIKVKFEYEVSIPIKDISYTKRLRYPVKYFTLDYSLDNIDQMTLIGQILGTLIDQPDITTEMNDSQTRICLRTRNWLLPKNGAVVVHCNKA